MAHTYENTDFTYSEGTPAALFGVRLPFSITSGVQTLTLIVNGEELSTVIDASAVDETDIDAQFQADLSCTAEEEDGLLKVSTLETGEVATLEVVPGGAATALGLEGTAQGISHPPDPRGWVFEGLRNDQDGFVLFEFSDVESPYIEQWGVADTSQKFSDKTPFRDGTEFVENFGAWDVGDPEFESSGSFTDLDFCDPPDITGGPPVPVGADTPTTDTVLNFENWSPPLLEDIPEVDPDRLKFGTDGLGRLETWGVVKDAITDVDELEFKGSPSAPVETLEIFDNALQGDVLILCADGAAAATSIKLEHLNIETQVQDTGLGDVTISIAASQQDGTGATLAQALVNQMRLYTSFAAQTVSESELGYGAGAEKRYVVVFSTDPELIQIVAGSAGALLTETNHSLDGSAGPFGGDIQEPESHWIRRYRFGSAT